MNASRHLFRFKTMKKFVIFAVMLFCMISIGKKDASAATTKYYYINKVSSISVVGNNVTIKGSLYQTNARGTTRILKSSKTWRFRFTSSTKYRKYEPNFTTGRYVTKVSNKDTAVRVLKGYKAKQNTWMKYSVKLTVNGSNITTILTDITC